MATKWPYHWSPGLILGAFCSVFRGWPVGAGLGAKFGRQMTEEAKTYIIFFVSWLDCYWGFERPQTHLEAKA
jgi:hypothetical protein